LSRAKFKSAQLCSLVSNFAAIEKARRKIAGWPRDAHTSTGRRIGMIVASREFGPRQSQN
jgi:hypothetical protein